MIFESLGDVGLLLLRIALGVIFIYHAIPKLKGAMGGFMRFIGVAEVLGGIALLAGFLTEYAAIGLAIIMLGAIYKHIVEWKTPFSTFGKAGGWEFDFILLAALVALLFLGAGQYAVDALGWL